ncbi:unnamed protein product [Lampetra fluviatilis]
MTGRERFTGKKHSWSESSKPVLHLGQELARWEPLGHHTKGLKGAAPPWEKKMATGLPHTVLHTEALLGISGLQVLRSTADGLHLPAPVEHAHCSLGGRRDSVSAFQCLKPFL